MPCPSTKEGEHLGAVGLPGDVVAHPDDIGCVAVGPQFGGVALPALLGVATAPGGVNVEGAPPMEWDTP